MLAMQENNIDLKRKPIMADEGRRKCNPSLTHYNVEAYKDTCDFSSWGLGKWIHVIFAANQT